MKAGAYLLATAAWLQCFLTFSLPLSKKSDTSYAFDLSVARTQLSAASVDSFALFAGGYTADGHDSTVVDIYDAKKSTWSVASLSTGRGVMASAGISISSTKLSAARSIAVFAGGKHSKGNRTSTVDVFDAGSGTWIVEHLSDARSMIAAVGSPRTGKMYFAGGEYAENSKNQITKQCSDIVDVWDVLSDTWSTMKLSQPRKKLGAAVAGSKLIFAGGYLSGLGNVDTADIYDEDTGEWTVAHLSVPRFRLEAASLGPLALFISGQGCDWTCATADVYDSRTNRWSVTNMSHGRYEFSAVVVDGVVVVAGGKQPRPKGINPNLIEVFDPATMTWHNSSMVLETPRYFLAGAGISADYSAQGGMALFGGGIPFNTSVEVVMHNAV